MADNAENKPALARSDRPSASRAQEMVDGLRGIFEPLCERLKPEIEPAVIYSLEATGDGSRHSE